MFLCCAKCNSIVNCFIEFLIDANCFAIQLESEIIHIIADYNSLKNEYENLTLVGLFFFKLFILHKSKYKRFLSSLDIKKTLSYLVYLTDSIRN